jgi:hypothetical protein
MELPNSQKMEMAKRNPAVKVIVRPSHEISVLIFFRDRYNFFIANFWIGLKLDLSKNSKSN